jgi:copper homeostasis protein (lipoprotein)
MKNIKNLTLLLIIVSLAIAACNGNVEKEALSDIKVVKGLYSYGPEIKSFTDCDEGREYWVTDSANTLELAYNNLNFEKPYMPVYIEVEGRVVKSDSSRVTANFDSTLVVTKLILITKEIPDGPCNQ